MEHPPAFHRDGRRDWVFALGLATGARRWSPLLLVTGLFGCAVQSPGAVGSTNDASTDLDGGPEGGPDEGRDADVGADGGTPSEDDAGPDRTCDAAEPWGFIGASCSFDLDCPFENSYCLGEPEGFVCGMCSQECTRLCPDQEGAPVTFCISGDSVGLEPNGTCVARCDYARFPETGCRAHYRCGSLPRFGERDTEASVCVPEAFVPNSQECAEALVALGLNAAAAEEPFDHPEGREDLICSMNAPVWLDSPILGVDFSYIEGGGTSILVSCDLAHQLAVLAEHLSLLGVTSFEHYGTYNCRFIAGSDSLSEHAHANAIDLTAFTLADGARYTIFDDWIVDDPAPATEGGRFLYDLAHWMYDEHVFNTILTPDFNEAHRDHFHVDLADGAYVLRTEH